MKYIKRIQQYERMEIDITKLSFLERFSFTIKLFFGAKKIITDKPVMHYWEDTCNAQKN